MQKKVFPRFIFHKFFFSTSSHFKSDGRSPYEILGVSPSSSLSDIKKAYHKLSKIYHPDLNSSKDAAEKFKIINNAYSTLKEYHGEHGSMKTKHKSEYYSSSTHRKTHSHHKTSSKKASHHNTQEQSYNNRYSTEEEILYEDIFGKPYYSDPMAFYSPENAHLRKMYEEKLQKIKKRKNEKEQEQESSRYNFYENTSNQTGEQEYDTKMKKEEPFAFFILGGAMIMFFFLIYLGKPRQDKSDIEKNEKSIELVEKLRENEMKKYKEKLEKSKENYRQSLGKMKKFSVANEPNALEILVDHTIYPDIKIYSVPFTYFYRTPEKMKELIYSNDFERTKIKNLKLNSAITLSLEAERCLKNVFVSVDSIKKSIEENGFYEPPGIFTRFFGFIYIKLRKMPINTEKIKPHMKYISLFDLYMRYYSPLPAVNEDFFEFKLEDEEFGWIGSVTLNHRKIDKIYLKNNEKNVFFWRGTLHEKNKLFRDSETTYINIWKDFYINPQENFK